MLDEFCMCSYVGCFIIRHFRWFYLFRICIFFSKLQRPWPTSQIYCRSMLPEVKCLHHGWSARGWKPFHCHKEFRLILHTILLHGHLRVWRHFWHAGHFGYMWHGRGVLFDGWAWTHVVFFIHDVVGSLLVIGWRHHYVSIVSHIFIYVKFTFTWKKQDKSKWRHSSWKRGQSCVTNEY